MRELQSMGGLGLSLSYYFSDEALREVLLPLIDRTSTVSLRALDYLMVNFSRKRNVVCRSASGPFNIHQQYRKALRVFRRSHFDPFRRGNRVTFHFDGKEYNTTVAQCNFVRFVHENGIWDWANSNASVLENDMNRSSSLHRQQRRDKKVQGIQHKRQALSVPCPFSCVVHSERSAVDFDI